jgi:hypothetical protein
MRQKESIGCRILSTKRWIFARNGCVVDEEKGRREGGNRVISESMTTGIIGRRD